MKSLLALCLFLVPSLLFADLTVTTKQAQTKSAAVTQTTTQVETLDGDKIGDPVLTVSNPVEQPAAPAVVVFLKSDRDLEKSLVKIKCRTAEAILIETGVFVVTTPGTHELDVNVISEQPLQWDDQLITITVGTTPEEPPPPSGDYNELVALSKETAADDPATSAYLKDFIEQTATNIDALCAANNCPSLTEAQLAYQKSIGNALGLRPKGSQTNWIPWRKAIDGKLKTLEITTIEQLKQAMLAVAKGLAL